MKYNWTILLFVICCFASNISAQEQSKMNASTFAGFEMRNVGPAFTSGRIADIAIHPENTNIWYVAVASGGVWKTENSGVTWTPIFDEQSSYSTGSVTIDPNNPNTIWVGTGENVGGRHIGFGDGIYKSMDGGASWKNMGLKESEHISTIIVHPDHSNIVWVAVQGPLWSKGGERGLYKTTDGGVSWKKTLGDDEWTGVTDIVIDPNNPMNLYAATWDRHRTVAAYMGGGPGSGIYRSTDGGETWIACKKGIPNSNLGKIGLVINPNNPNIVYAAIELDRREGGVFKSSDRGVTWEKQSNTVSGGTGPHYYQELYASPHHQERLYLMNVRILMSDNGGKDFSTFAPRGTHSDNHAMAFRPHDPNYVLLGTDGGLYESFDGGKNWRFIDNMPITQYYKVAVDDREPFYHIFGGTQDNGSHGGPSRTDNSHGIHNGDWYKTLFADGHQSATEPGNPNIIYAETQQGGLYRIDQITGEQVAIQPQAGEGEAYERYNWDAPIVVSPHDPTRLYFASQRVWRSDNRGNSWTAISTDLTRNEERLQLPIMGDIQSWDNPWDVLAMSNYNTITSLSESPVQEGLIYAGTDDGIIQMTEDGGKNWRKIMVGNIKGLEERAFINDIKADLHDANKVYVCLDNHKEGDYSPYLYMSSDKGKTWKSISNDLPERTLVWRLVQDHIKPELMFIGTEYGIYFTLNAGKNWIRLKGGVPTIPFRDLAIQKRENDLIGASFGRSFFVLDDYSPLREITQETLEQEAKLLATRDALWYVPRSNMNTSNGMDEYIAKNPDFGAVFTYYLKEGFTSMKDERRKKEEELTKAEETLSFPDWEVLASEQVEEKAKIWITVKDSDGDVVKRISAPAKEGFNRVNWDLTRNSKRPINPESTSSSQGWRSRGFMVMPGTYTASLSKQVDGEITPLSEPIAFKVKPLHEGALEGTPHEEFTAFINELEEVQTSLMAATHQMDESMKKVKAMQIALGRTDGDIVGLSKGIHELKKELTKLQIEMEGNPAKEMIGEKNNPTVSDRFYMAYRGANTTYGPTKLHKECLTMAKNQLTIIDTKLSAITEQLPALEQQLYQAGAPWIQGSDMER